MTIPTVGDLGLPILEELAQRPMTTVELEHALAERFHLTADERKERQSPAATTTKLGNRIHWAVGQKLGDAGLVTKLSKRSGKQVYGITEFGRSVLDAPPPSISHEWLCEHCPAYAAKYGKGDREGPDATMPELAIRQPETGKLPTPNPSLYGINSIIEDGCFLPRSEIQKTLMLLNERQNLVLQGPPGTGKTWLAKRLGYALLGERDSNRLVAIQFHPSLSYEDFVRGLRFSKETNSLDLIDGVFIELTEEAKRNPGQKFVLVIEEINRGNPAQIFGELLTLLEPDKRGESLRLAYPRPGEQFYVPGNLYVIGTMNLADRSLALVDFALRRRFAFVELEPELGEPWRNWCGGAGMSADMIRSIAHRLTALNEVIASDRSLGRQFRIGHSFVTPAKNSVQADWHGWFSRVIDTEIGPLLREYWYEDDSVATHEIQKLLEGFSR